MTDGAISVGASYNRTVFLLRQFPAANRASFLHLEFFFFSRPHLLQNSHHFRYDIARFLDDYRVANLKSEPLNLAVIVKSGPGNNASRHQNRRQMSHWSKGSGSADLRDNILHDGRRLLGRKFEGDGKPGRFAGIAQPFLPIPPVEFYRHSAYPTIFLIFFLLPL